MEKHQANVSTLINPLYSLVRGSAQMLDNKLKIYLGSRMKEEWVHILESQKILAAPNASFILFSRTNKFIE